MADLHDPVAQLAPTSAAAEHDSADRRRPGRARHVHPALLPLLRRPAEGGDGLAGDEQTPWTNEDDELGLARGIAVALLLVLPFWCAVAAAVVALRW